MKRFSFISTLVLGALLVTSIAGCADDPYLEGARTDLQNQNYAGALENIETALAEDPNNAVALELRGRILQEQSETVADPAQREALIRDMVESYDRASQIDPSMTPLIDQRLQIAWATELQEGIEAFNRGAEDESAYLSAASHFANSTIIAPDSLGGYINQAYAYMNANRLAEAIAPMEEGIQRGDDAPENYIRLASLYSATSQPDETIRVLREGLERHPGDQDMQSQLLNAFVIADRLDDAMQEDADLVQADPNNRFYQYNYGSLLLEAERSDDAVTHPREATRLDPYYGSAHLNRGAAYINQAVDIRDRINEIDDALRAERASLSREEIQRREAEIESLVRQQRELFAEAVGPLEQALDLAAGAYFEVSGTPGLGFTAQLSGTSVRDGGDLSRTYEGYTPAEVYVGEGSVSGTFTKSTPEGELRVSLIAGNNQIATDASAEGDPSPVSISENVGQVGLQGNNTANICQALFSAYIQTNQQDKAEEIADCAGFGDDMQ